jgi:hypothetical protein
MPIEMSPIDQFKSCAKSILDESSHLFRGELISAIKDNEIIDSLSIEDLKDYPEWESDISYYAAKFLIDNINDIKCELDEIVNFIWDNY